MSVYGGPLKGTQLLPMYSPMPVRYVGSFVVTSKVPFSRIVTKFVKEKASADMAKM